MATGKQGRGIPATVVGPIDGNTAHPKGGDKSPDGDCQDGHIVPPQKSNNAKAR